MTLARKQLVTVAEFQFPLFYLALRMNLCVFSYSSCLKAIALWVVLRSLRKSSYEQESN